MPLPVSSAERRRLHQRSINIDGFKRADGLWDVEARLVDCKDHVYPMSTGTRNPGEPVHEMSVRVTIDSALIPGSNTPRPPGCQIQSCPGCQCRTSSCQMISTP